MVLLLIFYISFTKEANATGEEDSLDMNMVFYGICTVQMALVIPEKFQLCIQIA